MLGTEANDNNSNIKQLIRVTSSCQTEFGEPSVGRKTGPAH